MKLLSLAFVCIGIWQKFIQDSIGLGTALLIIGIREVPVDPSLENLQGDCQDDGHHGATEITVFFPRRAEDFDLFRWILTAKTNRQLALF